MTTKTSWWVGKDRDAFNAAVKDHVERVVRRDPPPVAVPVAPPVEPEPPSVVVAPAPVVDVAPPVARTKPNHAWRPGSRGRIPKAAQDRLATATEFRLAILKCDEAADEALARAAIVMFVGFLFQQRLDWIVGWTGFRPAECRRTMARLRQAGIWHDDGSIACYWLELLFARPPLPKREWWKVDVAFWLDALVAKGDVTRETRGGEFFYGLPEWDREAL